MTISENNVSKPLSRRSEMVDLFKIMMTGVGTALLCSAALVAVVLLLSSYANAAPSFTLSH